MRKRPTKPIPKPPAWTIRGMPGQMGARLSEWFAREKAMMAESERPRMVVNMMAAKNALKGLAYRLDPLERPRKREAKALSRIYRVHPSTVMDALWYDCQRFHHYGKLLTAGELVRIIEKFKMEDESLVGYAAGHIGLQKPEDIDFLRETYLEHKDIIRKEMENTQSLMEEHGFDHMKSFYTTLWAAFKLNRKGEKVSHASVLKAIKALKAAADKRR